MCGVKIQGDNINNLRCNADDLQNAVTQVKTAISKAGLDINVKKTKTILLLKHPEGKELEIKVDDSFLEQVHNFIYFCTKIKNEAKTKEKLIED